MPTVINYRGDNEFYSAGSACSADSALFYSSGSNVDVYGPSRKRARISSSFDFDGLMFAERKSSIEILPDECLFEIFRHLPGGQERSAAACVSKHWLMLLSSIRNSEIYHCKSTQTEQEVCASTQDIEMISAIETKEDVCDGYLTRCLEGKKATDLRLAAIAVGTATRGGLGKLSIRGSNSSRGVTDIGLAAIAHGCPSLRVLSLWNVPFTGDEGLLKIAKECHLLEKLDLCECPSVSDKGLIAVAENCPNLTAITIESCPKIGNESLKAIGRCCPNLQSITVKNCPLIGDQGVANLLSSASAVLSKVKFQALSITDFSLAVIGHYGKAITNLVLGGLQGVSQKGFWALGSAGGLQCLESLLIASCRGTTDVSLEAIGKGCPNLKQMSLKKCCFVSDSGLVAFVKASGSLKGLHLEECNRITQFGILGAISNCVSKLKSLALVKCMGIKDLVLETPVLSRCESLHSLTIQNCLGFGSASLAVVGKLCPHLHHLDLSGLCTITDDGLLSLLESCEDGLVKVNLSNCLNLTDKVVASLARLHGETLEVLNLTGCRKLTDASLSSIGDNCSLLNDLDISKCSISDAGVAALSGGVQHNLQILSLSGCSNLSNKSMLSLEKLGKTLVGLNIQQCNLISSSAIEQLLENLWRCDILYGANAPVLI
ncbi:EIN3-binding F-box protein 2-like isoform X1 [Apium graveolens]|uniref:EIN3-binding F-box protein 2-like isoform X1 n=1 Tax=Apium graveolens TaxID=4045 RepID=UPI003D7A5AED